MFIFSLSAAKKWKKMIFILFCAIFFIILLGGAIFIFGRNNRIKIIDGKAYDISLSSCGDLTKWAGQFGIQIDRQPVMTEKVTIPLEFNAVYQQYNDTQKRAGFDLEPYKGKQCLLYTFEVQNDSENDPLLLNVLVYENIVIGADVSEKTYDGFVKSLNEFP